MARDAQRAGRCVVAGGGPAGMMLGLLLARAGVDVTVLEKHADFARDFRGDTIHPATMAVMDELGLLEEFLRIPHTRADALTVRVDGRPRRFADFRGLRTPCSYVALMPQWDFLDFLARHAAVYPTFHLARRTRVTDLLWDGERVVGVRARGSDGDVDLAADLVVAADGRHSVIRSRAGLPLRDRGVPFDVLWFRLPKRDGPGDATFTLAHVRDGSVVVTLDRVDYWQCGLVVRKESWEQLRADGLPAFRAHVARVAPILAPVVDTLTDWEQVRTLIVRVDRLTRWSRPGLLCIGDAAHAMSPAGGVGINYAVADAVATANLLADRLREGRLRPRDLRRVQRRRQWPVRLMQAIQTTQGALIGHMLPGLGQPATPPARPMSPANPPAPPAPLTQTVAGVGRRAMGRLIGLGFRPEHVRTPNVFAASGTP